MTRPPPGTRLWRATLSENVTFDFRTLPAPILGLVESRAPGALEVATDWLEETGRLADAELLRTGRALFVNGQPALRWGLLRLGVVADGELQIDGVGESCMPYAIGETPRWSLLAQGRLVILASSLVGISHRRTEGAKVVRLRIVGERVASVLPPRPPGRYYLFQEERA